MRHLITIATLALLTTGSIHAQMPKWVIAPAYDNISIKVDNSLIQTDSLGTAAIWTLDGRCLQKTPHRIGQFKDGTAVVTSKGSGLLVGAINMDGRFSEFPDVRIAYDHPYFESGYIVCSDTLGNTYYNIDGEKANLPKSIRSYPFFGGYASFFTYDNMEKKKDPYYGYYRADGKTMKYRYLEKNEIKELEPKSISFLSSIGDNNKGVAVIKNRLYLYNPDSELFEPFLYGDDPSDKKRHLSLAGDMEKYFLELPDENIEITAKYGKNQKAILQFDKTLRPVRFIFEDSEQAFNTPVMPKYNYTSDITAYAEGGKKGIESAGKKILPPQFDDTGLIYGNRAFVKHNGKWGVVEIIPDLDYTLKLNKDQDIAFRHQTFDTQVRLDLPAEISAKDARIDIPESSGLIIDKTSRETKDTESGNFVVYDCSLRIPDNLPDTVTNLSYSPVKVTYDGLSLYERPINIKGWHVKYYNVDPIESETSISNGVATFTININAQKNNGENDYPFELRIDADSVDAQYEKISETRYKCLVSNLQEGDNSLNIIITEKGCPPSIFPFEISYTKPTPKKKTEEKVVVRKKTPQTPKPQLRIDL